MNSKSNFTIIAWTYWLQETLYAAGFIARALNVFNVNKQKEIALFADLTTWQVDLEYANFNGILQMSYYESVIKLNIETTSQPEYAPLARRATKPKALFITFSAPGRSPNPNGSLRCKRSSWKIILMATNMLLFILTRSQNGPQFLLLVLNQMSFIVAKSP